MNVSSTGACSEIIFSLYAFHKREVAGFRRQPARIAAIEGNSAVQDYLGIINTADGSNFCAAAAHAITAVARSHQQTLYWRDSNNTHNIVPEARKKNGSTVWSYAGSDDCIGILAEVYIRSDSIGLLTSFGTGLAAERYIRGEIFRSGIGNFGIA